MPGAHLHRRLAKTQASYWQQLDAHEEFTAILEPGCAECWVKQVEAWEADQSLDSPYYNAVTCESRVSALLILLLISISPDKTMNEVKTALEETERRANRVIPAIHKTTATACLMLGLLIEDMQYVFSSGVTVRNSWLST